MVVGEINCRYWTTTPAEVNYYTCSEMSLRYEISSKVLFSLNPGLAQDCSNVQAETAYCVRGCKCSLPPALPARARQTKHPDVALVLSSLVLSLWTRANADFWSDDSHRAA